MKLLIIGGTRFLGRHIAEAALARGHELTLFHRGQTNADLFPEAEHIHGDRALDMSNLEGGQWDAVIDTCGYFPRIVGLSCEALKNATNHYNFISSVSVYADFSIPPNEQSAVGTIEDETMEEFSAVSYGPLKALCEKVVQQAFGDRALIVRPGLIVGPHDPTDRFSYWPVRIAKGGDVLVPNVDQQVQIIDVRDLAEWCLAMGERQTGGVYNATGPDEPYRSLNFFERMHAALNPAANLVWVDDEFLAAHEVQPWSELPCILPFDGSMSGMASADISRALANGLQFRPLEVTARDTLAWRIQGDSDLKAGLKPDREQQLLADAAELSHR